MKERETEFNIGKYTFSIWWMPPKKVRSLDLFFNHQYDCQLFGAVCLWYLHFGWWRDMTKYENDEWYS